MSEQIKSVDRLLYELKERAKELNCLYEVQELLNKPDISVEQICQGIVAAIPPGWQFPDICQAKITLRGISCQTPDFRETPWMQSADILVRDEPVGRIIVCYTQERPLADEGPFLKEERKLIDTICEQFGLYLLHQQLKEVFESQSENQQERRAEWWVILNLLKRTDPKLLLRISRKMINYLSWNGIPKAEQMLAYFSPAYQEAGELFDANRPSQIESGRDLLDVSDEVFELASRHFSSQIILENIQLWIKEDQSGFLVNVLVNPSSSLADINAAIERYHHLALQGLELSPPRENSVRVSLIRRLLCEQPGYIDTANKFIDVDAFHSLLQRVIHPVVSHGKLGGKSAGLFLAQQMLKESTYSKEILRKIKFPKTWYLASDNIFYLMGHNNLEDIVEQKYKDIIQARQEYPYIVHAFKNATFPPEIIRGLSLALDEFGEVPLIIRSSSLLEDRIGMSFAGKYKSLFIANRGSKDERLVSLMDAIAEVYASMFGPDPIEYRAEHGLIDEHEEMGVMIQEVVGARVGPYYLPAYSGVAFSHNEFPWSSRIKRKDGLARIVPGLGTRAVDRLSDDYPVMVAPGQPGLRVNVSLEEIVRYAPRQIDVINLESGSFETINLQTLLRNYGAEYPGIHRLISIVEGDHIHQPLPFGINFEDQNIVFTFEGLFSKTPFLKRTKALLNELQNKFGYPVDIEFAFDGKDYYLLQCRAQSYSRGSMPAEIPSDIPSGDIVFIAEHYVSNGMVSDISHIVYVDPAGYSKVAEHKDLLDIGRAVGRLNKILPKRRFILLGPGRWGSRGDIRLGVNVTYSDINNTAMLIEIARKKGDYLPELSFGTHFFQDLVEASIRYLPLYPDDPDIIFNEGFLIGSHNVLGELLPDFAHLAEVVRVIDIHRATAEDGIRTLQVHMNAEKSKAVAYLA